MNFNDIIGQPVLVQSLKNAINNSMISNAYIFNGPKGCGKKTAAKIFAAGITCKGDNKPCEICPSCVKTLRNSNPDIVYLRPDGNNIKIKQIRDLISSISSKPYENLYRVIIIEESEKMMHASQDAFLKTLEEPEGNNVFIILTENYNSLHQTIVSRCQLFNFHSIGEDIMKEYLKTKTGFSLKEIEFAIEKSSGIIGRAIEILESGDVTQADVYYDLLSKLLLKKAVTAFKFSEEVAESKEDAIKLFNFLLRWFTNMIMPKSYEKDNVKSGILREYKRKVSEENAFMIIDIIKQGIRSLDFNVNAKNIADNIFLKIMEVING